MPRGIPASTICRGDSGIAPRRNRSNAIGAVPEPPLRESPCVWAGWQGQGRVSGQPLTQRFIVPLLQGLACAMPLSPVRTHVGGLSLPLPPGQGYYDLYRQKFNKKLSEYTMLRILSLNYEYPPIGGGGGHAHRAILKAYTRFHDIEVTLVTSTTNSKLLHEAYSNNIHIYYIPLKKKNLFYWRRSEVIHYLFTHYGFLHEHLKENTYDLCHVFFGFPSGLLAYLYRKKLPYLVSVRGSDVPGYNKRFSLDYILLKPLLKRIYKSAQAVVANSAGLGDLFQQQFPSLSAEIIPNGVDIDFFKPLPREPHTECSIVTSARLIPRKGIDLLIKACHGLYERNIPFHCHIIGDGPEKENLMQLARELEIEKQVTFHGRLERESIPRFLPECDVFVLPSYAEGMSNAALEAMACGLPLVLTDTGGTKELIEDNGVIIPTGDQTALEETLSQLLTQPQRLQEMGEQSRARAHNFSWEAVAQQYHDLYYRIAAEHTTT